MNIDKFLNDWIAVSNAYDTEKYLEKYLENAILDDISVGNIFVGHEGIRHYFTSYFIEYKTQTRLVKLNINKMQAHIEVEFTGEFPEKQVGGTFDFKFKNGKIEKVTAALV